MSETESRYIEGETHGAVRCEFCGTLFGYHRSDAPVVSAVTALPQPDLAAGDPHNEGEPWKPWSGTPGTDYVRMKYVSNTFPRNSASSRAEFDRWLTSALAAARKEGQEEAINWIESYGATVPGKRIGRAAFFARSHFALSSPPTEKSE